MDNQRAIRRTHTERLRRARRKWWGRDLTDDEKARVVDTPTPCSCWMCGNPRKYFGERTIQERKAILTVRVYGLENFIE